MPTTKMNTVDVARPTGVFEILDSYAATKNLTSTLLEACVQTDRYVVNRCQSWCNMIGARFFRLNTPLTDDIPLDTTDDEILMKILWETEIYLHRNRTKLKQIANLLVKDVGV